MNEFSQSIARLLRDFYRCPEPAAEFTLQAPLGGVPGYFRAGGELCYGRLTFARPQPDSTGALPEAAIEIARDRETVSLCFDPAEVINNFRFERYTGDPQAPVNSSSGLVRRLYYLVRPLMPVNVRKHLQRRALHGWERISFPTWPMDRTVDRLHERLLAAAMKASGAAELPFVWFWPDGKLWCATMTHDVETAAGRDFCGELMALNETYGIRSSFQIIPEERYHVSPDFIESIRTRGFEVNVHDLNHDGNLFSSRELFSKRVAKINAHGKQFGARGFRSAVLYRRPEWMHELGFAYDMSLPSVGHLDPQRGGCCTVMPFFLGGMVEIPVTVIQDYSLFHIACDYSTRIWERQLAAIGKAHGLANFIVHPDYVIGSQARESYVMLLRHLVHLRANEKLWISLPGEVNDWWRARAQMEVVCESGTWRVVGDGSERACVAFARLEGDALHYSLEPGRVLAASHQDRAARPVS